MRVVLAFELCPSGWVRFRTMRIVLNIQGSLDRVIRRYRIFITPKKVRIRDTKQIFAMARTCEAIIFVNGFTIARGLNSFWS